MTRFCRRCRRVFEATPYRLEAGGGTYCGKVCRKAAEAVTRVQSEPIRSKALAFEQAKPTSWWTRARTWDEFKAAQRDNLSRMQAQARLVKVATLPE